MTNPRLLHLLLLALSACGDVSSPPPGGDDDPGLDGSVEDPPGTVSIVSTMPADNEAGVAAGASITIAFSKPMDQPTVEAAWQSADLQPSDVTFSWDDTGATLTVKPDAPLELAQGTGLDPTTVVPRAYAYSIGTGAKALDGSTLAGPLEVGFTTLRRLDVEQAATATLTRTIRADGVVFGDTAVTLVVGDSTGNLQTKIFATFSLPRLPLGSTVDAAVLQANQNGVSGDPYALGNLRALHTASETIDASAFTATPLAVIGDLSTTAAAGARELDVTAQVLDDIANGAERGRRSQYRLEFATAGNANGAADEARLSRSGFGLVVSYVIP